jgi:hypothetical protein
MPLLTVTTEMPPVNNQNFGKLLSLCNITSTHHCKDVNAQVLDPTD